MIQTIIGKDEGQLTLSQATHAMAALTIVLRMREFSGNQVFVEAWNAIQAAANEYHDEYPEEAALVQGEIDMMQRFNEGDV